jgi:hypothetical protein
MKSTPVSGDSLKVDKPLSPQAEKSTPEPLKPSSPKGVPNPTGPESAPTSLTRATSSHDDAGTSPRLKPIEFVEVPCPSPQSGGLRATGGP